MPAWSSGVAKSANAIGMAIIRSSDVHGLALTCSVLGIASCRVSLVKMMNSWLVLAVLARAASRCSSRSSPSWVAAGGQTARATRRAGAALAVLSGARRTRGGWTAWTGWCRPTGW
jgi:hypothetical protein